MLRVVIVLLAKLVASIFAKTPSTPVFINENLVLKSERKRFNSYVGQRFYKSWFSPVNVVFLAQLACIVVTPTIDIILVIHCGQIATPHTNLLNLIPEFSL